MFQLSKNGGRGRSEIENKKLFKSSSWDGNHFFATASIQFSTQTFLAIRVETTHFPGLDQKLSDLAAEGRVSK